ncbi:amidohydrolase family protein [Zhongshania sp.]|uniref:metal-dependent hydrolase family protein n=1 Tax=Zhongshania sp. TaxID=1971902 RepID=UPI003562ADFA
MKTLIRRAKIWDASGAEPFEGDLLVVDERIQAVSRTVGQISEEGCQVIDAAGKFLMPGMTEGHGHLSFDNVTTTEDLITPPPEEHTLLTARVAKRLLDQGFTSVWGASEAKLRLGVAVRNEVDAGNLPGPRIRAGSLEITVTGGMGDESKLHNPRNGPSIVVDGPEEMRKAVRMCCREGCDNIKLDVSGDPFYPNTPAHATPMSYEEVRMAVETAHSFGRRVNAHVRSIGGIQTCVRAGVDVLFHCEFTDPETLDMLEEAKDRIFVVPTVSLFHTLLFEAEQYMPAEVAKAMGIDALLEASSKTHTELRKRGIRHAIGGDYGFAWSHNGTNARDIGFFVKYFGYSTSEALRCATSVGGAMMTMGSDEKLGELKEGYLADMILVDGDPLQDPDVLVNAENLHVIIKNGAVYKNILTA